MAGVSFRIGQLKNSINITPVFICHVDGKFGVVNIQSVILITHKSPMQAVFRCIGFECIEFIFYLAVDIFIMALAFAALGFDYPDGTVFFHHDIVGIEQPLFLNAVQINDREILLPRVSVFVDPLNIIASFAILLKKYFTCAADKTCGKTGSIVVIGI